MSGDSAILTERLSNTTYGKKGDMLQFHDVWGHQLLYKINSEGHKMKQTKLHLMNLQFMRVWMGFID